VLSIIVPTLNEGKYLPLLLKSIKKQDFKDYEIIVADAKSKDKTRDIAKKYGCKITEGGRPAYGRNKGAKEAAGNVLLFLDADVILPRFFLKKSLIEFKKRKLEIATFCLTPINKKNKLNKLSFDLFYNIPITKLEKILPHAATGILIKKDLFVKIKGYDETIKIAEDHDLGRRAARLAKYGIIRSVRVPVSERRFEKEGWAKTGLKYFLCEIHMLLVGPIRSDVFNYKFDHYEE